MFNINQHFRGTYHLHLHTPPAICIMLVSRLAYLLTLKLEANMFFQNIA
jgi:hypothetical protein